MNSEIDNASDSIYKSIKNILTEARENAYSASNFLWQRHIGKIIVEEQQGKEGAEYEDFLIKFLAEKLTKKLGAGFDRTNLIRMRSSIQCFQKVAHCVIKFKVNH